MSSRQFSILLAISIAILGVVLYTAFRPCMNYTNVPPSKDGRVGILGTGKIVVFVKNGMDGSYHSGVEVELQRLIYPPLPSNSDTTDSVGKVVFSTTYDGFYFISVPNAAPKLSYVNRFIDDTLRFTIPYIQKK
jgi:hypothetical protein